MNKPLTQAEYDQLQAHALDGVALIDRAIVLARDRDWHHHAAEVTRARDRLLSELLDLQRSVTVEGQAEPEAPRLRLVHDAAHAQRMRPDTVADGPAQPGMGGDYSSEEGA